MTKGVFWFPNQIFPGYDAYPTEQNPNPKEIDQFYAGNWFDVIERRGPSPAEEWLKIQRTDENGAVASFWSPRIAKTIQYKPGIFVPSSVHLFNPPADFDAVSYMFRAVIVTDEVSLYKSATYTAPVIRPAKVGDVYDASGQTENKFDKFWYTNDGVLVPGYVPAIFIPEKLLTYGTPYDVLVLFEGSWEAVPLNGGPNVPPPDTDNPGCSAKLAVLWQAIKVFFGMGK